ncbi:MAG: energy-coupling factor transporter ATPase [Pseudoclavibacter sp.]
MSVQAAAPLLHLDGLRITHEGATRATPDGVTLTVDRGEVVLLLGPSGCGKSTLALAAGGLVPGAIDAALEGAVRLGGVDATSLPSGHAAARVAMVFQDPDAQLVTSTVADEVAFGPENLGVAEDEIDRRVARALAAVGLTDRAPDAPEVLSGGGRQRLAIACALALGSPLLVLDEPTANLDPAGAREVYDALAPLVAAGTHGVLLIEHNLDEALRVATRVVALDARGRIIADGAPREVLAGRADELVEAGVWLPLGVAGARMLEAAGAPVAASPLTAAELIGALEGERSPESPRRPGPLSPSNAADAKPNPSTGSGIDSILTATSLTVQMGGRTVLDDISLEVERGSFTAVVGPNGAGKSTLLHALAGVDRPPKRSVFLDGDDVARLNPRDLRRRVGVVFQNPEHQFLRQRVRAELELGVDHRDPAVAARVDDLLGRFGLREQQDLHPFVLSGGGKRRLSVGTALVAGPPLLVLDEPTYGQDRARAAELLDLLEALRREGTTIVMATHDLQLVAEHASHVIVLADGRVADSGPTAHVIAGDALDHVGLGRPPLARATRASRDPALRDAPRRSGAPCGSPRDHSRDHSIRPGMAGAVTLIDRPTLATARETRLPWLHRVHPLAKVAATLPMIIALFFVRDLTTPLVAIAATLLVLATGTAMSWRAKLSIVAAAPVVALVLSVTLGVWADVDAVDSTPLLFRVGPWPLHLAGWLDGLGTGLRMVAIVLLALLAGASTSAGDFVRSLVQQLRVPYRFGYAALASFRFVPRFRGELATIRRAHRVRGIGGRGPIGWVRGRVASVVPLLAAALRHADRVAIAMEARAFGYADHRTERHRVPLRVSDVAVAAAFLVATVATLVAAPAWHDGLVAWLGEFSAPQEDS